MKRIVRLLQVAATVVVAIGASAAAWAQDYTVNAVSGRWVSPPANSTDFGLLGDDAVKAMPSTPFPIPLFGRVYNAMSVCTNGFVQFGGGTTNALSAQSGPLSTTYDGICGVAWADDYGISGANTAAIRTWTDGVAPNRRFIIAWLNWSQCCTYSGGNNFQIQFNESSGNIVMAYTGSSWASASFGVCIDEPNGSRFVRPAAPGSYSGLYTFSTPVNDWEFVPRITNFTGTLLFDRYVVDTSGIGNASEQNVPLTGLKVELRDNTGAAVASAYPDATGAFNIQGMALPGSVTGSLAITAQSVACVVKPTSAGTPVSQVLQASVPFASNLALGTFIVNEGADPGGAKRAAFNIARTVQGEYDWARARTSDAIAAIDVLYDTNSILPTSYSPAGANPAFMRVSAISTNPDPWDVPVIRRTYARHVLASIAANPGTAVDSTFDLVTDDPNAFAEGFGYYMHAALSADPNFTDGLSPTAATVTDLENPTLTTPRGSNVAGWVAAALFDLTDDANEAWDTIDGRTSELDRPFRTVDFLTSPVTAATFYKAWGDLGFNGPAIATNFIRHGLIPDDADEPNDSAATASVATQFGFIKKNRVLNLYNEDWYSFTMPQPTNSLTAQVVYDRNIPVTTLLELRSSTGTVIATGAGVGQFGPIVAASGPLPAGTYVVSFKHLSGAAIPTYALQAFSQLAFSSGEFQPWTVGRPYNVPVNVKGGIPPYDLEVKAPFIQPPGLILDGANARVRGTPSVAGLFGFVLSATDAAEPANVASGPVNFLVNGVLDLQLNEFQAMPYDKDVNQVTRYIGGTAPYTSELVEGTLPSGIAFAPGELRLVGRPDIPGSYPFALKGTDVAVSTDTGTTTGVVCVPFGPTPLALGKSACGFYFDALVGTTTSISVKTSAKRAKRSLRAAVLDTDGSTPLDAKTKAGKGSAALSGFVAPATGRYYFVVASDVGDTTELAAAGKVVPPKAGRGGSPDSNFVAGKTQLVEIGALPGAVMSFVAKPDKSGLALRAAYMLDPAGTIVAFGPGEVVEKAGGFTVNKTFATGGTWTLVIGAYAGNQGAFTYSFKLKQPKGLVYSAD